MAATTATSASSSAGAATSRSTCPEPEVDPHTAKLQVSVPSPSCTDDKMCLKIFPPNDIYL